jgi:hypothetical protein
MVIFPRGLGFERMRGGKPPNYQQSSRWHLRKVRGKDPLRSLSPEDFDLPPILEPDWRKMGVLRIDFLDAS